MLKVLCQNLAGRYPVLEMEEHSLDYFFVLFNTFKKKIYIYKTKLEYDQTELILNATSGSFYYNYHEALALSTFSSYHAWWPLQWQYMLFPFIYHAVSPSFFLRVIQIPLPSVMILSFQYLKGLFLSLGMYPSEIFSLGFKTVLLQFNCDKFSSRILVRRLN